MKREEGGSKTTTISILLVGNAELISEGRTSSKLRTCQRLSTVLKGTLGLS